MTRKLCVDEMYSPPFIKSEKITKYIWYNLFLSYLKLNCNDSLFRFRIISLVFLFLHSYPMFIGVNTFAAFFHSCQHTINVLECSKYQQREITTHYWRSFFTTSSCLKHKVISCKVQKDISFPYWTIKNILIVYPLQCPIILLP